MALQIAKIPVNTPVYKNVDSISLKETSDEFINGFVDESNSTRRRPGVSEFANLGTNEPVDGLFFWESQNLLMAVSNGQIFKIKKDSTTTEITGATLNKGTIVTFAQHGNKLVAANGANMVIIGPTSASTITSYAPTEVSHVAFIDQYIVANLFNTRLFYFSDVAEAETWNPLSFASPVVKPDIINAIHTTALGEIYFFGPESLEVWVDDAVNPFSPLQGAQSTKGCIAPYSIVRVNETFFYLDNSKRLVFLNGRQVQAVDAAVSKSFQEYDTVEDAYAYFMEISGKSFLVLNFPTEKATWVYDVVLNSWAQWGYWDSFLGAFHHWLVRTYAHANTWNLHLGGDRKDTGKIFSVSMSNRSDDTDLIRFFRRTGHVDHNTYLRKRSHRLAIKIKSGVGNTDGTASQLMLKWRNDNEPFWKNERIIDLKTAGNSSFFIHLYNLGIYRSRQYEFSITDDAAFTISDVEETYEVLRN